MSARKLTKAQQADLRTIARDLESLQKAAQSLPRAEQIAYGNAIRSLSAFINDGSTERAIRVAH